MTIQESNIVFLESQVMDDVPEGGGAATGTEIPDGVMNNVFEDISDLDRAYGRFNLRKVFLAVRELGTSLYSGVKTVVTGLPTDPALGYTLFTTNDPFDVRTDAASAVEAYLYKGPMWNAALLENHITGMRAISVIQRVGTQLPPIGKTLCLVQDEGEAGEKEQYIRVIKVEATETTFEDSSGEFTRWVVRLDLSDALRYDFLGHSASRTDSYNYTDKARLRDTTVADATRYYSSQPLVADASIGDLTVKAASVYTHLVPSAQTETPLISQILAPELVVTLSAGIKTVSVPQQSHTKALEVTAENRRLNWIETLVPSPAAGLLTVAYRALGNWYVLQEDGAGVISGSDPSYGSGTLDSNTATMAVTLGALPDAGSQILLTWGSVVHYAVRANTTSDADTDGARVSLTLPNTPILPTSVTVDFYRNTSLVTATTNSSGVITGTGVAGTVDTITGDVALWFTVVPDRSTVITVSYQYEDPDDVNDPLLIRLHPAIQGPGYTFDLAQSLDPGSLKLRITYCYLGYTAYNITFYGAAALSIHDDGAGRLVIDTGETLGRDRTNVGGTVVGAINYTTGWGDLATPITASHMTWTAGGSWTAYGGDFYPAVAQVAGTVEAIIVRNPASTALTDSLAYVLADDGLQIDLTSTITDRVVAGSVRFTFAGKSYDDRNGTLYADFGSGDLACGTLDYAAGSATLTYWQDNANVALSVTACLTVYGDWTAIDASFRTTLDPIKPESLSIVASTADGEQITGSADADGVIAGTWMRGNINYEFGTAALEFGQLDSGNWVSRPVDPSTIRYNAVAYSYIPLDATILGIDAVRLPSDGRVPIYRAGDVVQLLHPDTTTGTPTLNGTTGKYELACGRTRVAFVKVTDANGAILSGDDYTLDRDNGIVAWATIAGITTPVTIKHTVGDLRLVTDVQIDGTLTLARELTHDYPADESLAAACLIQGDRRARVSATWDQATWGNVWEDYLIGSAATATLNLIDYPITVTNEGCDTDRWLLRWTSTTNVELISEKRGVVWTGSFPAYVSGTPVNIEPINPRTRDAGNVNGTPYMVIDQRSNGGGWSAGNVLRINTVGAIADFWIARSIAQSDEPLGDGADGCEIYALGNIDRP